MVVVSAEKNSPPSWASSEKIRSGAIGLVLNALVLFTTRCMDAAVNHLRADGFDVRDEGVARLSPFIRITFHMLGLYSFQLPDLPRGLRPLRDPDAADNARSPVWRFQLRGPAQGGQTWRRTPQCPGCPRCTRRLQPRQTREDHPCPSRTYLHRLYRPQMTRR